MAPPFGVDYIDLAYVNKAFVSEAFLIREFQSSANNVGARDNYPLMLQC